MPFSLPQIIAIIIFAISNILFAITFSHMALLVYRFYVSGRLKPVYVPKTKILLYPLLIALGGFSFLYPIFNYIILAFVGADKVDIQFRYFGLSTTFVGVMIVIFGMYKFYKDAKNLNPKGASQ